VGGGGDFIPFSLTEEEQCGNNMLRVSVWYDRQTDWYRNTSRDKRQPRVSKRTYNIKDVRFGCFIFIITDLRRFRINFCKSEPI